MYFYLFSSVRVGGETQHGDDTVDVENIFLFRAEIDCTNAAGASIGAEAVAETASVANVKAKSEPTKPLNCVWTYEANEASSSQVQIFKQIFT